MPSATCKRANLSDADNHLKFPLSPFNGLAPRNCQTWASLTLHRPGLFLGRALINPLHASAAQSMSASLRKRPNCCVAAKRRYGRVEDGRGNLGHAATLRFPSTLIEPDVPISGIRRCHWLHREAHGEKPWPQASSVQQLSLLRLTIQLSLTRPDHRRCLQAHRQSPPPRHLRKHTRSQGPSLRRYYPASTVI